MRQIRINLADLWTVGAVAFVAGCAILVRLVWLAEEAHMHH